MHCYKKDECIAFTVSFNIYIVFMLYKLKNLECLKFELMYLNEINYF